MGYCTEPNVRIEFCGKSSRSIKVGGEIYKITPKTFARFQGCTSSKEYVESIEYFACQVLVKKNVPNDGWFEKWFAEP